jgi:hypothetical protein
MTTADQSLLAARRPFVVPTLTELPPLVALTLQTGAPIDGGGGSSGIGFSLARLLIGGTA